MAFSALNGAENSVLGGIVHMFFSYPTNRNRNGHTTAPPFLAVYDEVVFISA